ncbi:triose-phosphate isomerase (plasmid) [Aliirhizobium terrae]|uniref:triose-phosphate isomerase n=1 Tax=Terrirhizobium terrae TaxID=2926709 RepID=UPI0025752866|nr:triose-phosphate isomerase [Rhizobium sp. CC-CFT758]WJH37667.1 triose-phosphate isomerase [Rhizobium sp. CC-CFT758]
MGTAIKPLVAGNWKMNGVRESLGRIEEVAASRVLASDAVEALICVPSTLLHSAAVMSAGTPLRIGAQNCHHEEDGAFTGDISAGMIADSLGSHAIVGHSERRMGYRECDATVRAKAAAAHKAGLAAIICIGETEEEQATGLTLEILRRQLAGSVPDGASSVNTIIAYEPVWAIGTGRIPSVSDIAVSHAFIRDQLSCRFEDEGVGIRILYGGSVNPSNAAGILEIDNVNGALVGGASLRVPDYLAICAAF